MHEPLSTPIYPSGIAAILCMSRAFLDAAHSSSMWGSFGGICFLKATLDSWSQIRLEISYYKTG
jgi:hypothetical protein